MSFQKAYKGICGEVWCFLDLSHVALGEFLGCIMCLRYKCQECSQISLLKVETNSTKVNLFGSIHCIIVTLISKLHELATRCNRCFCLVSIYHYCTKHWHLVCHFFPCWVFMVVFTNSGISMFFYDLCLCISEEVTDSSYSGSILWGILDQTPRCFWSG